MTNTEKNKILRKFAFSEIAPVWGNNSIVKLASAKKIAIDPATEQGRILQAEIQKHPNALFFRAKAIKANEVNSNGDYFSEEELLKSYKSFEGVPFFTNHENQNIENAKGKIIFAEWNPQEKAVYTISFIDRDAYPHICRSIEEEYVSGVSMGFLSMYSDITMSNGLTKKISEVEIGDTVLSALGNECVVEKVYSEIMAQNMFELDLGTYHKSPLFSHDHPVYVISDSEVKTQQKASIKQANANKYLISKGKTDVKIGQDGWRSYDYTPVFKETKDLVPGDYALIPTKYKLTDKPDLDNEIYYLGGAYVGDGYIALNKHQEAHNLAYYIGLHEKKELGERLGELLTKYSTATVIKTPFEFKNGLKISVSDRKLSDLFSDKFGRISHHKRIYQKEFTKEQIYAFVSGYIDTDGTIAKTYNKTLSGDVRGNGVRGALISSCNQKLLEDLQSLLILVDTPSYITWNQRLPNKNSLVKVPTLDFSLFIPFSHLNKFKDSIKVRNLVSEQEAQIKAGKTFIFTAKNGQKYMACPIKKIVEREYEEACYDLTIKGDESYIADGVAVHNCSCEYSTCSICENAAESTTDYCTHIKNRKGRKFTGRSKNVRTGEVRDFKDEPCFEYNFGIKFIELSAVVDPACPSCHIQGIVNNNEYIQKAANKVANKINDLYMFKEAALDKKASKEEIEQLDGVLKTLEEIAVKLIQQRKQVEPEFASDLVNIITEMQSWFDELVAAGYGNLQATDVPGTDTNAAPEGQAEAAPEGGLGAAPVPGVAPGTTPPTPVSNETALGGGVGDVSGNTAKGPVSSPALPITAPIRPRAGSNAIQRISDFDVSSRLEKGKNVLEKVASANNSLNKTGEEIMAKRRTLSNKLDQKENTIKVLSNSWQEKQEFFEYIKEVPSIQDNNYKLSVKKHDDTFVVVAETKSSPVMSTVWGYDDLSPEQKDMIRQSPQDAAEELLTTFANSITHQKEGESMTYINKAAGANSVNKNPDVVTQKQLDQKDLYHARTGVEQDEITQKQLNEVRTDVEQDQVFERQLDSSRTEVEAEVVTQKQLEKLRKNDEKDTVTQKQLDGQRTGVEQDQVTERQLDKTKAGWARAAKRDASLFKSASEHMDAVVDAVAETVVTAGCTPEEVCESALALVASTESRVNLAQAILEPAKEEQIDYAKRLAFWAGKNLKVAAAGKQAVAEILVNNLRKIANDTTINPETLIAAVDVVSEGGDSVEAVAKSVEEKIALANAGAGKKTSMKDELRKALAQKVAPTTKVERETERKEILASLEAKQTRKAEREVWAGKLNKAASKGDHLIEASFEEVGVTRQSDKTEFKKGVYSFTKGALAANNMKLASITNVTISGNTIQIAVQTDDGSQSVEIPIGESTGPGTEETMPEGDMSGEGLENSLSTPPAATPPTPAPTTASSKKLKKVAQSPMGGGMGQTPGGVSATGAGAPVPPGGPATDPVEALTTGDAGDEGATEEVGEMDEIPSTSEKQMPWSICPECGSSDVDVTQEENGGITGNCKNAECGAKYEAMITKNVEFKIVKPKKDEQGAGAGGPEPEAPATPEVPAIPVAAQTSLNKKTIQRMASNKAKHGNVCPACGTKHCTASVEEGPRTEYACENCGTHVTKELLVNANNLDKGLVRVSWDLTPETGHCKDCEEKATRFASDLKVQQILKKAAKEGDSFPTSNCKERIARQYGAMTLASNGPCKGQLLTDCVCNELKRMGLRTVRHMERLASAFVEKDPMDQCVEEHSKKGVGLKEASALCGCIKNKVIAEKRKEDPILAEALDNTYLAAFYDDIKNGKEKVLTANDLIALKKVNDNKIKQEAALKQAEKDKALDADIGEALPEITKKETTASMKIKRSDTPAFKLASTPTLIQTIEHNDKVPRSHATMGKEGPDNIDVPMAKKVVPRGSATMGKEGPDNIDVTMKQVDIPVGNAYMGGEAAAQQGMPPTNTQIKGTVIAHSVDIFVKDGKIEKISKNLKEVDTVEKDDKVPRGDATMGNEGKDNIDVTPAPLKVPRGNAAMGEEGKDNIDVPMEKADVPMGDAYMGGEKDTVGKPANNDEMLTNVKAKRDLQLSRIASARESEAIKTASWLAANGRIASDKSAFDNVVKALSAFEIGQIPTVAEQMFPVKATKTASSVQETKEAGVQGFSIPTIVQEPKVTTASEDLVKNLIKHMALTKRLPQED